MYYECWEKLVALFPQAKLIHLIRDGRDVSLSLEQLGWHGPSEEDRAAYWHGCVVHAFSAARLLGDQRNLIVRYEDLVLNTRTVLTRICRFLHETFEADMLRFYEDAGPFLSNIDGGVHGKTLRPSRPDDVGR